MARGILSEFGPDSPKTMARSLDRGGVFPDDQKDVMNYCAPYGPRGIGNASVGLKGNTYPCGSQGPRGPQPGQIAGTALTGDESFPDGLDNDDKVG